MHWPTEPCLAHFVTFTLVLARVAALVMIAPLFGPARVPPRARIVLALALALLVVPLEWEKSTAAADTLSGYLVLLGGEALVGLTLGLGVMLLFSSMQVAGGLISQMSGLQLAEVFDPGFETNVPLLSQLLCYVTAAVFVTIGGHRRVVEALMDTFARMPIGQNAFSHSIFEAMAALLTQSFVLGVRAAAPAMVALLLATLILGLVSRALPQLNLMVLGFGFNAVAGIAALGISLGATAWVFQEQLEPFLETALRSLTPG